MNQQLMPFDYEGREIRVVKDEQGDPWFVAADVCAVLQLPETHKAVARLDDDEKDRNSIPTPGGSQSMTVVSESGLYNLVLGSRKAEAKRFKRWVATLLGFDIQEVQLNEIRHSALLPIGFAVACAQASHVASNARA